jgi:excisionase family DNA binding protein
MHQPEHLTLAQAADRIGVSRWTVRRWVNSGKLQAIHPGGGTNPMLVTAASVDAIVSNLEAVSS